MMSSDSNVNSSKIEEETVPAIEVPSPPPKIELEPIVVPPVVETRKKSSSFSIEDEERFLRDLGWTPEEEESIPELTSEEIVAVKNLLVGEKSAKKVVMDTRKWPHNRRAVQTVL
jgi:hypothetical protein